MIIYVDVVYLFDTLTIHQSALRSKRFRTLAKKIYGIHIAHALIEGFEFEVGPRSQRPNPHFLMEMDMSTHFNFKQLTIFVLTFMVMVTAQANSLRSADRTEQLRPTRDCYILLPRNPGWFSDRESRRVYSVHSFSIHNPSHGGNMLEGAELTLLEARREANDLVRRGICRRNILMVRQLPW